MPPKKKKYRCTKCGHIYSPRKSRWKYGKDQSYPMRCPNPTCRAYWTIEEYSFKLPYPEVKDRQFRDDRFRWSFIMPKRHDTVMWDESSILHVPVSTKEILCYLKFGKCDPKTLEIYEKLKDPSQGDD